MVTAWMVCMQVLLATASGTPGKPGWTSRDIGNVAVRGSARYNEGAMTWTVRGAGTDIFDEADSCHYAWQRLQGDGSIVARIESLENTDPWAKSGVMIRESLEPGSRFVGVYATPSSGVCFQARARPNTMALADTEAATREQQALRAPIWVKLERRGNEFRGYYAADAAGTVWTPMNWKPPALGMFRTVYIGLAVTSHAPRILCEARFSGVAVNGVEGAIPEAELLANPRQVLCQAFEELEQLGNWRADRELIRKRGEAIAGFLFTIARARELDGAPAGDVLPEYYRVVQLLPDCACAVDALAQIVILDANQGLAYAEKCLATRSREEQNRFYVAVTKHYLHASPGPAREAVLQSFVAHVAKTSGFALFDEALAGLENDAQALPVYQSLIRYGMALPANRQTALTVLRTIALKERAAQQYGRIEELMRWVTAEFQDAQLVSCAAAILADTNYDRGHYADVLEALQPGLGGAGQPEARMVENLENALRRYRTDTLLQNAVDPERIYRAMGEKAGGAGRNIVALHCLRRITELRGYSLEDFAQAAAPGVKYSASGPENEVRFWEGLLAAEEGDLGAAAVAYQRFVQGDPASVLAAKACCDIARAKMALGEEAQEWVAQAKALSPCAAVKQLERRLNAQVAAPAQK